MSIYGPYEQILSNILSLTTDRIKELNQQTVQDKQPKLYEHLIARVKTSESMAENANEKAIRSLLNRPYENVAMQLESELFVTLSMILTVAFANYVKLTGVRLLRKRIILQMQSQMDIGAIMSLLMKKFHIKISKEITRDIFMLKFSYERLQWIHGQVLNMR